MILKPEEHRIKSMDFRIYCYKSENLRKLNWLTSFCLLVKWDNIYFLELSRGLHGRGYLEESSCEMTGNDQWKWFLNFLLLPPPPNLRMRRSKIFSNGHPQASSDLFHSFPSLLQMEAVGFAKDNPFSQVEGGGLSDGTRQPEVAYSRKEKLLSLYCGHAGLRGWFRGLVQSKAWTWMVLGRDTCSSWMWMRRHIASFCW